MLARALAPFPLCHSSHTSPPSPHHPSPRALYLHLRPTPTHLSFSMYSILHGLLTRTVQIISEQRLQHLQSSSLQPNLFANVDHSATETDQTAFTRASLPPTPCLLVSAESTAISLDALQSDPPILASTSQRCQLSIVCLIDSYFHPQFLSCCRPTLIIITRLIIDAEILAFLLLSAHILTRTSNEPASSLCRRRVIASSNRWKSTKIHQLTIMP